MKGCIFTVSLALVINLLNIISICDGSCYNDYKDELPARIKWWKTKEYGLEITGEITRDHNLNGLDEIAQNLAKKTGRYQMMSQIDSLIEKNKKKGIPDFTISKLDPISYEFDKVKMLITFSNVELTNLDGYSYDKKSAKFSRKGVYEIGKYELDDATYDEMIVQKSEDPTAPSYKNIEMINGKRIVIRKDCKWTFKISAKFVTQQKNVHKPIIIKTRFKIQPADKTKNEQETESEGIPLRASGVVEIEIHDFEIDLSLDITHIDDHLKRFLEAKKRSHNLVPDFDVNYGMKTIEIKKIDLLPYDEDDTFSEKIDKEEHVNDNLPWTSEENSEDESSEESLPVKEEEEGEEKQFIEDDRKKALVVKHFEVLKDLVQKKPDEIRKKLCLNVLPKMAWKVMQMDSKKQFGYLFYQIIAYEDGFNEKTKLPKFTVTDLIYMGMNYVGGKLSKGVANVWGFFRNNPAST